MARILIGVSGGIAAYKTVELARLPIGAGHAVRVIQTPDGRRFVGAQTFAGITGAPVLGDEFEDDPMRGAYPGNRPPSARRSRTSRSPARRPVPDRARRARTRSRSSRTGSPTTS